ncbi:MAG: glutamate ligase domain-containing protein [Enterocloster sp.]
MGPTVYDPGRFYNACPESMKAAFQVFKELHPERRHVAVLAEMRELGHETESAHRQVGIFAAEAGIHLLVTLGAECRALTEEFKKRSGAPVAEFTDKDQMTAYLDQALQDGDCVLFKGANSMALFKVAARYMENRPE